MARRSRIQRAAQHDQPSAPGGLPRPPCQGNECQENGKYFPDTHSHVPGFRRELGKSSRNATKLGVSTAKKENHSRSGSICVSCFKRTISSPNRGSQIGNFCTAIRQNPRALRGFFRSADSLVRVLHFAGIFARTKLSALLWLRLRRAAPFVPFCGHDLR